MEREQALLQCVPFWPEYSPAFRLTAPGQGAKLAGEGEGRLSCESDTAAVLRAAGQKVTPQRMLILGSVRHAGRHITASQILEEVRAAHPYVDASTVYRTLAAAKELKLVSETNLGSGDNLFEWVGHDHHHHLVCRSCGSMTSLEHHHLDALADALAAETGFQADLSHIAIFGVCSACQVKGLAAVRTEA